jgi:adenylate kinase family enzyme
MLSELFTPRYTLNVDRSTMPQVKSTDIPDLLQWLQSHKHISHHTSSIAPHHLKFVQSNFNTDKIEALMQDPTQLQKPVLVSSDHYVIDGNHRVLAQLNLSPFKAIPIILLGGKVLDILAALKEYPKSTIKSIDESFTALTEASERHSVLTFGRMNPPTSGHAKLVDKVHEVAKAHQADHHVVLSHSQDAEKNPLSTKDKLKHAKRAFPGTHVTAASKDAPTIFHHAAALHKAGTKHLHVVVGSDRVKEFHDSLHKYNGHFNKDGQGYKFKSITVHSAGHRDPDAKGTTGMSASKMREHAQAGKFKEFKKGVPTKMSADHTKELYHDTRKGMGHLKEEYQKTEEPGTVWGPHPNQTGSLQLSKLEMFTHKPIPMVYYSRIDAGRIARKVGGTVVKVKDRYYIAKPSSLTEINSAHDLLTEGVHDAGIFKAIFITGAPGSGKDFVMKKSLHGHGLTEINSDKALEHLMDKHKLDKKMSEHEQEKRGVIRDRAKSLTDLRQRLALHGRNGLIVNGTGAKKEQIKKLKGHLEELGYDTKMVFVDASDNVSRNRNIERGQRGGRMIPEKSRMEKWREAQDARVDFAKMFGSEHYHEFNNDDDLRHNTDPEIHSQKTKELDELFKTVRKFTQQPPKSEVAHEWIHTNLGKLAKQPIGNKQQQKQASQTPPASDSQAAEEARKLGLQYFGYGRYGKGGRVTHFSLHGRLIEKQKALTPPKPTNPPKKLNEAFEDLLTEETDHEPMELRNYMESVESVGGSEVFPLLAETRDPDLLRAPERRSDTPSVRDSIGRQTDRDRVDSRSRTHGHQEIQEDCEKRFEEVWTAIPLTEGDPIQGGGEEDLGSSLSTASSKEALGGGLVKDTPIVKKDFRTFRKGKTA